MKIVESLYAKIFPYSADKAIAEILQLSKKKTFVRVGFAYFAQLEMMGWFEKSELTEEMRAIFDQDYILPDGIAIRLLHYKWKHPEVSGFRLIPGYKFYARKSVANLNGTDLVPRFFWSLENPQDYRLVIYGAFPEFALKAANYAKANFGLETVFQDGYKPFERSLLSQEKTNILLVWQWSPRQEKFMKALQVELDENTRVIAFGVGGLFDFWGGREKRAPRIMKFFALEWLWRAITHPKKNLKKTLVSLKVFWYLLKS